MPFHYTSPVEVRPQMQDFTAYTPGLTIDEIRERYHLERVIKLASNETPLGTSPLVQKTLRRTRYFGTRAAVLALQQRLRIITA